MIGVVEVHFREDPDSRQPGELLQDQWQMISDLYCGFMESSLVYTEQQLASMLLCI